MNISVIDSFVVSALMDEEKKKMGTDQHLLENERKLDAQEYSAASNSEQHDNDSVPKQSDLNVDNNFNVFNNFNVVNIAKVESGNTNDVSQITLIHDNENKETCFENQDVDESCSWITDKESSDDQKIQNKSTETQPNKNVPNKSRNEDANPNVKRRKEKLNSQICRSADKKSFKSESQSIAKGQKANNNNNILQDSKGNIKVDRDISDVIQHIDLNKIFKVFMIDNISEKSGLREQGKRKRNFENSSEKIKKNKSVDVQVEEQKTSSKKKKALLNVENDIVKDINEKDTATFSEQSNSTRDDQEISTKQGQAKVKKVSKDTNLLNMPTLITLTKISGTKKKTIINREIKRNETCQIKSEKETEKKKDDKDNDDNKKGETEDEDEYETEEDDDDQDDDFYDEEEEYVKKIGEDKAADLYELQEKLYSIDRNSEKPIRFQILESTHPDQVKARLLKMLDTTQDLNYGGEYYKAMKWIEGVLDIPLNVFATFEFLEKKKDISKMPLLKIDGENTNESQNTNELHNMIEVNIDKQEERADSKQDNIETQKQVEIHTKDKDLEQPIFDSQLNMIKNFLLDSKKILDECVYGHDFCKQYILQVLGQQFSKNDMQGKVFGLQGPPGNGKTSLIKNGICRVLKRPFTMIALGGISDGSLLEGHDYTYEGSRWGKMVQCLMDARIMNPVIYFDELDKVSETYHGQEIIGILTHLIDFTQNDKIRDRYFNGIDLDFSQCIFIFSFNDESKINPVLKDRIQIFYTQGFSESEKVTISRNYLLPQICENFNFLHTDLIFSNELIHHIIMKYTNNEEGVREIKKKLELVILEFNYNRIVCPEQHKLPFEFKQSYVDAILDKFTEKKVSFSNMYM